MERRKVRSCCVDQHGNTRPFHLCCLECRRLISAQERGRLLSVGRAPRECGPDVVKTAPARGPVRLVRPTRMLPDGKGGWKVVDMGYRDRAAMVQRDVFDVMLAQAKKRGAEKPFSDAHVLTARAYRDLYQHCQGAGYKCSRAFDLDQIRSGQGGQFMDALMRDMQRLERFHRAIGNDIGMNVRRVRPSERGTRRSISDRALVDMICIEDKSITRTLDAFGWSGFGKNRKALRRALCAILERMEGI